MNADAHRLDRITEKIIGCAYQVANILGSGFLEKVYENALAIELTNARLAVAQQKSINVIYAGQIVGDYVADLLVEGSVLVELKATRALDDIHMAQCLNYLKATGLKVCLLMNFGQPRIEVKRIVNGFSDQCSSAFIGGYVKNPT
ncbi:MAG: GxxExxY protein [SAR324 cluster bacterium]|nr:GxxExxY protein [SAR324 cluster bacterium]